VKVAVANFTGGGLSGGSRKYLECLVPKLASEPGVKELHVFLPPQATDIARALPVPASTGPARGLLGWQRWVRREVARLACDVVFIPTAQWLDFGGRPTVVLVRNMEPLAAPWEGNSWTDRLKNAGRLLLARRACHRATRVIAVSHFVRDFLVERWGISEHRVGLVYHGLESNALLDPGALPVSADSDQPFVFTAGSIRPARGLEDLIHAWPTVRAHFPELRLIVGGAADSGATGHFARLKRMAAALGIADHIVWAGTLNGREMAACYRRCAAFVMTSRAEACPNVALEAMHSGALCVSTDTPPMPEFFQSSALYYGARQPAALARTLVDALTADEAARRQLRAAARRRAAQFSWSETARRTVQELQLALAAAAR
jgi:glycosyltransferase involved in cell wall biosynthesis